MIDGYLGWLKSLGNCLVYRQGYLILIIMCVLLLGSAIFLHFRKSETTVETKIVLNYLLFSFFGLHIIIFIQSIIPYVRIFSYLSIVISLTFALFIYIIYSTKIVDNKKIGIISIVFLVYFAYNFSLKQISTINSQSNDSSLKNIYQNALSNYKTENILFGDEYSYLNYCFYNNTYMEMCDTENPDIAIFENIQLNPNGGRPWPCFYEYEDLPWVYINNEMKMIYKDHLYTVYISKTLD